MAGHPLRSATDRRLGGPLPHQLPNQTRAHRIPPEFFTLSHARPCAYAVLAVVSNCCPPVYGRLPTRYSLPSENFIKNASFDLHVLSTPPAFILSQDQTLCKKCIPIDRLQYASLHFLQRSLRLLMHTAFGRRPDAPASVRSMIPPINIPA